MPKFRTIVTNISYNVTEIQTNPKTDSNQLETVHDLYSI